MAKEKWRNRTLQRGVFVDKPRGYVYVRFQRDGLIRRELIGRTTDVDVIDRANFRAQQIRHDKRRQIPGFHVREERLPVERAADLFFELHGKKRRSAKGVKQFIRYVRLIKEAWTGRYVDTITPDDMRDYRDSRRNHGVAESTINREQTAIVTMFNRLSEWRRSGQIARNVRLPEVNPGRGVKKVSEDRFIRERLMSDEEYENLFACSDERTRRIILAEMSLPLRLEDLKQLSKKKINYKLSQFKGIQAKTGREYALPINEVMWDLVKTAPGDQILDFTGFERNWRRAVRRAGLKHLQFRDLRRTAAMALHDSGETLRTISAMLGHSSVTTTIRYLGLKDENLKQAGNVLASKYRRPVNLATEAENVRIDVQTVPKTVPQSVGFEAEKDAETRL